MHVRAAVLSALVLSVAIDICPEIVISRYLVVTVT